MPPNVNLFENFCFVLCVSLARKVWGLLHFSIVTLRKENKTKCVIIACKTNRLLSLTRGISTKRWLNNKDLVLLANCINSRKVADKKKCALSSFFSIGKPKVRIISRTLQYLLNQGAFFVSTCSIGVKKYRRSCYRSSDFCMYPRTQL